MTYRLRNIGIALALALVAALMVTFYVSNYRKNVQAAEENVTVLVAAQDIPAGTTAADAAKMMEETEVVRRNVAPGSVASTGQLADKVVKETIFAGEQVSMLRFADVGAQGIRSQISGNERAMQIAGDQHQLLAGTLAEGDRVDVVANWSVGEGANSKVSRTILRDLLVLKPAPAQGGTTGVAESAVSSISVTLALTDSQAQKLFWAAKNGDWHLELRPPNDAADSSQTVETTSTLLLDGMEVKELRRIIRDAQRLLPASAAERSIAE